MIITLAFAILGGALAGGVIAAMFAERRHKKALSQEFQRGIRLGEQNAKHHNRTFVRYVNVERLTPEQVMPGPFVEEPTS